MNEHGVARKSHDATQKKCLHVVHFKVPRDGFETSLRHQKRYSKGDKKIRGCRGLLGRVIRIPAGGRLTSWQFTQREF